MSRTLTQILEDVISRYGGEPVKNAVMYHLTRGFGLDPERMLEEPDRFTEALRRIYGQFEEIIEKDICEEIINERKLSSHAKTLKDLARDIKNSGSS